MDQKGNRTLKTVKALAVALGVVIVALILALIFVPSAHAPTPGSTPTPETTPGGISNGLDFLVRMPEANAVVTSPVGIEGAAAGNWFFEASFPIEVMDADGRVLGTGHAQALGDWMTSGTVQFAANIPFTAPRYATGTILFKNDNPSGLPANAKQFELPVRFSDAATGSGNGSSGSGVQGQVTLGPTCPVEHIPPDPACAPRAYETSITIARATTPGVAYRTIMTDASGTFSVSLPAGSYVFTPESGNPFPRCSAENVTVNAGQVAILTLSCDTGIR